MKVLLSIKPEFVREIFAGNKKYEYRKAIFTKNVNQVVVYSTKPEGMIVGEFTVETIIENEPQQLWDQTKEASGITKEFFDQYFEGRKRGYALKISSPKLYENPINPFDLFSSFSLELFFSSVVFFSILLVSFSEVLPKFTVIHPVATTRILAIINKIILFFFIFFSQIFLINFLIYKIIII